MPVYNNPGFAQGVESLARLFMPPSPQDMAAAASAAATREKAARLQALSDYAKSPNFNQEEFDRQGIAAGEWSPTQGYHALDVGAATTRRGQDLESGDRRYNTDTTARTTLQTNAADNARALGETKLKTVAGFFAPIGKDQVRPAIPSQLASHFDYSGDLPAIEGPRSPMSETEWRASQYERLRQTGQITDQEIADLARSSEPPVEAKRPDGRDTFMSRGEAIRTGAQPALKSPTTVVNTGAGGDSNLRKNLDENEGKRWSALQAAASTAGGLQQDLDLLSGLIDQAPQGPLVGRLAEYFPEATTAGSAFQSIVSRAAPGLRVEGSGATSDIEYEGMMKSLPRLRNDPQANRLIVDMMRAKAGVNVQRGEIVSAYQNGRIDASQARDQLAQLNRQSLLTPELRAAISRANGGDGLADVGAQGASAAAAPAAPRSGGSGFRQGQPGGGQIARPTTDAEFAALPTGALYLDPDDGKTYRK